MTGRAPACRLLSLGIVGLGVAFSLSRFLSIDAGMRHVDTQWLHAAAACFWEGKSPYNAGFFAACWSVVTDAPYRSTFVFGMPILPLIAPLGGMDAGAAYLTVDIANALALLALAPVLWIVAEMDAVRGWGQVTRAVWLAFGLSLGGIAGAGFVGQPAIFVALGIGLTLIACQRSRGWALIIGTLLCLSKPHICLLPLGVTWLWRPLRLWGAKLITVGLFAASVALAAGLDGALATDFPESLRLHGESSAAKLSDLEQLYSIWSVLDREGAIAGALLVFGVSIGAGGAAALLLRRVGPDPFDGLFLAALLGGLFLFPVKDYDLAVLAPAYALLARQSVGLQVACALPMVLLWRPGLADIAGLSVDARLTLVTIVGVATASALLGASLAGRMPRAVGRGQGQGLGNGDHGARRGSP